MEINTIIVDNFLDDPHYIRQVALNADFHIHGNYPGRRTYKCDEEYNAVIKNKIELILNKKITSWFDHLNKESKEIENADTSCFQLCLENDTTWIHSDPNEYTAILYLTPNAITESGTGIFRHKKTGIYWYTPSNIVDDVDINAWEMITFIGNIFNRLVIFKGNLYHRSVKPGFGHDKYSGRITQTFFFNTEEYDNRN